MTTSFNGSARLVGAVGILTAAIAVVVGYRAMKRPAPPIAAAPATQPASAPATTRAVVSTAAAPKSTGAYLDAVRAAYPDFPTTQPLGMPLELSQAAHLILSDPIYLGAAPRAEMWITRADASPMDRALKDAVSSKLDLDAHVVRERVAFVHWMPADGVWPPYVVCQNSAGGYDVISAEHDRQRLPIHRAYHWDHAFSWNEKVVVPADLGISILHFGTQVTESFHPLATAAEAGARVASSFSEPRVLLEARGLVAWLPWEPGKSGGRGAAHYVESADSDSPSHPAGTWTDLTPEAGWPEKILHMVPLLDGTVLMLKIDNGGAVDINFNTLEHAEVKEEEIAKLVDQLSDTEQATRKAAYDKLTQYGSGIWPILEKLIDGAEPEAQTRMRQLLKQRVTPTLNGMTLLGDKSLQLAARLTDGGTVFFSQSGVSIPNLEDPDAGPDYRVPAWISIRPGRPIELLPSNLTADLTTGSRLNAINNDWIISSDSHGPRRFVGNGFVTLLRKSEQDFSELVGLDRRGRWLFRKPSAGASTTAPATRSSGGLAETLIIDPSLPDPIPRLPVWVFRTSDSVGWTRDGWAVATKASSYALHETEWALVDEKEQIFSKPQEVPPPTEVIPAAGPTTMPSTLPTTFPATLPAEPSDATALPATMPTTAPATDQPLLTDRDGSQYFGGLTDLRIVSKAGKTVTWPLPAVANGQGPAWLVRTGDGKLFLFNQPGRVLRIKATPTAAEPFAIEKVFTHRVPTVDHPTRIWLDPAGRIVMAWENELAFFFPAGYIPPAIAEKMLPEDRDDEE